MTSPRVTVVIPAFNAARHVGDALESICAQTLREVEVLVIDDGSTDDTVHVVDRYSARLNLTIVRQGNAGPAAARNAGVRRARAPYCAFLDADDEMLPERLAAQVDLLDADPALGLVHSDLMTFDEGGVIHRTRRAFSDPCGGMVLDRLLVDNFITTSTVTARKARLIEAGLFGEHRRISEDFELWLRMAARWGIGYIDRPLVRYRRRAGSLSDDKLATARCAVDVVQAFWREHPQERRLRRTLYRQSVSSHLATAGTAALAQRRRGAALVYLVRALALDPSRSRAWRSLAKVFWTRRPRRPAGAALSRTGSA